MKRVVSILLAILMVLSLISCKADTDNNPTTESEVVTEPENTTEPEQNAEPEVEADTITVVDMAGRTVEVPINPKSICYTWGGVGSFIFAVDAQDMLVAVNMPNDFLRLIYPEINDIGTVGRGVPDMEAIAALNPDIFFHRAAATDILDDVQALGIPSIGVMAESHEEIIEMLTLIGKVLGKEEEAAKTLAEFGRILDKAKNLTADIPDDQKMTAILMGSELGRVAHGKQLQSILIEAAGGISCTAEDPEVAATNEAWATIGVEKIFEYNPDYIFVTNNFANEYTVEELYADPAWANLKAVQNHNILPVPSDLDSWEFPGVSSALGALWMVSKMYPSLLSEEEFEKDVVDFYLEVFNFEVSPEILGY